MLGVKVLFLVDFWQYFRNLMCSEIQKTKEKEDEILQYLSGFDASTKQINLLETYFVNCCD